MDRMTIKDAPGCLNTNDKAMWATGWNECLARIDAERCKDAVAWKYELAGGINGDGEYCNWSMHITTMSPTVPEQAVRALQPLYAAPPAAQAIIAELTQERDDLHRIVRDCLSAIRNGAWASDQCSIDK